MCIRCYIAASEATTNDLIKLEMSHSCRVKLRHTVWEALHEIANRSEVCGNAWNLEILQPKLFLALWRPAQILPIGAATHKLKVEQSKRNCSSDDVDNDGTQLSKKLRDDASIVPWTIIYTAPLPHCTAGQPSSVAHPTECPLLSTTNDDVVSVVVGDKATAAEAQALPAAAAATLAKFTLDWHYHWRFNCGRLLLALAGGLTAHRINRYIHIYI